MLTIAVNKGRVLTELLPLFEEIGIVPIEDINTSRKLLFETKRGDIRLVIMRGSDVPVYVEQGAADLGITGKDTLLEYAGSGYYEKLDLQIARCRIMTASPAERAIPNKHMDGPLRVATKYVRTAQKYYAEKGIQVKLIKLSGAMEIAPLMNLADEIVDIVDTGNTMVANGLVVRDTICNISSRVIVNRASMKLRLHVIQSLLDQLRLACTTHAIENA